MAVPAKSVSIIAKCALRLQPAALDPDIFQITSKQNKQRLV
jgi:hypothetical protein